MVRRVLIGVLGLVLLSAAPSAALAQGPASISGTVTAGDPVEPVSGVTVSLERAADGATVASDETDGSGTYRLTDVPADAYRLTADATPDYAVYTKDVTVEAGTAPVEDITLDLNPPPTATILDPPERLIARQPRNLAAEVSDDVVSWLWTRVGATTPEEDTAKETTVEYEDPGPYQVSLTVADAEGATATVLLDVVVNSRPTVSIAADLEAPETGDAVTFTATGTDTDEDDTLTYAWDIDDDGDFGDGTEPTRDVAYPAPGTYTVRVQVTDGYETTEESAEVTVVDPPPPSSPRPTPLPRPAPVPVPAPTPAAPLAPADVFPPDLTVRRRGSLKLDKVRKRGLKFTVGCDEACTVYLEVVVGRKVARKLRLGNKPKRLGRVQVKSGPEGTTARLKLSNKARKRLKRAKKLKKVKLTLQGSAWDAGGYATLYAPRKVTLRRAL